MSAPFVEYFSGDDILEVHHHLIKLFNVILDPTPDAEDEGAPLFRDSFREMHWTIHRHGLPDWQVRWSLFGRAKLRRNCQTSQVGTEDAPPVLVNCTRIKPGSIVCRSVDVDSKPEAFVNLWKDARQVSKIASKMSNVFSYSTENIPTKCWKSTTPVVGYS